MAPHSCAYEGLEESESIPGAMAFTMSSSSFSQLPLPAFLPKDAFLPATDLVLSFRAPGPQLVHPPRMRGCGGGGSSRPLMAFPCLHLLSSSAQGQSQVSTQTSVSVLSAQFSWHHLASMAGSLLTQSPNDCCAVSLGLLIATTGQWHLSSHSSELGLSAQFSLHHSLFTTLAISATAMLMHAV